MKKDLLAIVVVVFLCVLLFSGVKIQSVEDYYTTHIDDITEDSQTVYLSVDCKTLLGYNEVMKKPNWEMLDSNLRSEKYVPKDGIILKKQEYVLRDDDSVFDILNRAMRYNKIHIEYSFSVNYNSTYVQGINQIYEFSCGELSGWMYKVNGAFPSYGASVYKPKHGDYIEFVYTCDLGRDVGNAYISGGVSL